MYEVHKKQLCGHGVQCIYTFNFKKILSELNCVNGDFVLNVSSTMVVDFFMSEKSCHFSLISLYCPRTLTCTYIHKQLQQQGITREKTLY